MLPALRERPGFEVLGDLEEMRFEGERLVNPWPEAH